MDGAHRLAFNQNATWEVTARGIGANIDATTARASLIARTGTLAAATVVEIGPEVDAPATTGRESGRAGTHALPIFAAFTSAALPAALTTVLAAFLDVDALAAAKLPVPRARPDLAPGPGSRLTDPRPA